jgi:hypothetical protein
MTYSLDDSNEYLSTDDEYHTSMHGSFSLTHDVFFELSQNNIHDIYQYDKAMNQQHEWSAVMFGPCSTKSAKYRTSKSQM